MVSHKHRCIFVHIPKVAGISIEQVFLDDLGLDFHNRASLLLGLNTNKNVGPPRLSHLTATEYVEHHFISETLFQSYFKFSFVRNPYDRIYSFYRYLGYSQIVSFETFILKYIVKIFEDSRRRYFIQPMHNFLYSADGHLLVDFIGKLESINEDFEIVQQKLGLPTRPLAHINNSKSINIRDKAYRTFHIVKQFPNSLLDLAFQGSSKQYTNRMKDVVQTLYGRDFECFDYKI